MKENESLLDIFALLYGWRKQIIGISFIASVLAALASLTLDNYYQASTVFYAASPDLAKPNPIGSQSDRQFIYGSDHDLDRLFSIANSNDIKMYLASKFDLYKHYEIDSTDSKGRHKLMLKINKLYETIKTKYDAIQLNVEDKDPEFAANMANAARVKIDALSQSVLKTAQLKQITALNASIKTKEVVFKQIQDSLNYTRKKFKIFNTASQGEAFGSSIVELEGNFQNLTARVAFLRNSNAPRDSVLILEAKKKGVSQQLQKLKEDISSYNEGYETIVTLERQLRDFGEQLNIDKQRLAQIDAAYAAKVSSIHLIEKAEKPVVKSRPKRSILVIGVGFITFVLMSLWVIVSHQLKKYNWKKALEDASV